jgi:hypothetical protein
VTLVFQLLTVEDYLRQVLAPVVFDTFLPLPDHVCALGEAKRDGTAGHLYLSTMPGTYKTRQDTWIDDIEQAPYRIDDWIRRIREDLAHPIEAEVPLDEFRQLLEEKLKEQGPAGNVGFSSEEIVEMAERLDAIAARLSELQERQQITE